MESQGPISQEETKEQLAVNFEAINYKKNGSTAEGSSIFAQSAKTKRFSIKKSGWSQKADNKLARQERCEEVFKLFSDDVDIEKSNIKIPLQDDTKASITQVIQFINIDLNELEVSKKLQLKGKYGEAAVKYKLIAEKLPDCYEIADNLSFCLCGLKQFYDAQMILLRFIRTNQTEINVWEKLSRNCLIMGKDLYEKKKLDESLKYFDMANNYISLIISNNVITNEAVEIMRQLVELSPRFFEARINFAIALCMQEIFGEALQVLDEILYENLNFLFLPEVLNLICLSLCAMDRFNEAKERIILSIDLDPKKIDIVSSQRDEEVSYKLSQVCFIIADTAYKNNNFNKVLVYLGKAIEFNTQNTDAYGIIANILPSIGNIKETKALREKLANYLIFQKKFAEALLEIEKIAKIDPTDKANYNNWGNVLCYLQRFDEAQEKFLKSIDNTERNIDEIEKEQKVKEKVSYVCFQFGKHCYQNKEMQKALDYLGWATKFNSHNTNAYTIIGHILHSKGDINGAKENFRQVITIEQNDIKLLKDLVIFFYSQNNFDEALVGCEKIAKIDPTDKANYNIWGNVLCCLQSFDEAQEKFLKSIDIIEQNTNEAEKGEKEQEAKEKVSLACSQFGQNCYQNNELKRALSYLEKAIKFNSKNADAFNTKGVILAKNNKYDEASENLTQAINLNSKFLQARSNLATILKVQGKFEEEVIEYVNIANIDSNFPELYERWGLSLYNLRKYDEAKEKLNKVIEQNPNSSLAYYVLGSIFQKEKDHPKAIEMFERSAGIDPN